jgi:crooked neck
VYERAVANLPPANEKRYWQRYIYLWIKYALFEELDAGDMERAREVYRAALKLVPHHVFTFSKVQRTAAGDTSQKCDHHHITHHILC